MGQELMIRGCADSFLVGATPPPLPVDPCHGTQNTAYLPGNEYYINGRGYACATHLCNTQSIDLCSKADCKAVAISFLLPFTFL